ncbi:MAG: cupin fold metalloprotein, WbuC family [Betaproteobacteria bacterium]|nr:cupin fold metalloprotein, WbuC family [Betaproteobacteria bacterium]
MQLIDGELLDRASTEARRSPRLRRNHNFHDSDEAVCHRLLNAVEPGSYVRPHRHLDPDKDETFVVLRGSFGLVLFDDEGNVTRTAFLRADGDSIGATVPHGTFHTLIAFEQGSVFFESKAGPYRPLADAETASWAPEEGSPETATYLAELEARFVPQEEEA